MIGSKPRLSQTPAGVRLGSLDLIADGRARNFVLEMQDGLFYGFVVRKGAAVFGYVDLCPHRGLPLTQKLDEYLTPDGALIACTWHGALFRIEDGLCVGGPCKQQCLQAWPVQVQDGQLVTG